MKICLPIGLAASLLIATAAPAAVDPFYAGLYERGIAHFRAGDYASAQRELKIAAFGFVEDITLFETAYIYGAIAASKLQNDNEARTAARRIVAAEHVQHAYATLPLPQPIRDQFEALVKKLLKESEIAVLRAPTATHSEANVMPPPTPVSVPRVVTPTPPPAPAPASVKAAPPQPPPVQIAQPVAEPQPVPISSDHRSAPATTAPVSLAEAEHAINSGDLPRARTILFALINKPNVPHTTLLDIGAALYRTRAFSDANRAFERSGSFEKGEERYHYYYAVSLYEAGRYALAKREIAAALPYVERTADVEHYRAKIEGSIARP
jgi:tetratricopeptide (TPR) repeat protein